MAGPLEGVCVIELALAIQGPAVGFFFSSMGADVVKVEPPMGDASRYHRGVNNTLPATAYGSQFVAMNKGKRSVSLDLKTEMGLKVMERLLASADVFVSNYRASALARMGLELEELTKRYPRLVVGHVNGFGPKGPEADKAMLDGAAQARGGITGLSGAGGAVPMPPGAAIADHAGAMQTALACVTALYARAQSARGQLVQTSSLGAQLWLQMWELQHSFMTGVPLTREGSHHPNIKAPYGVYMTRDDVPVMYVAAMTDESWTAFWLFVDMPEALLLEQWDTPGKRIGVAGSDDGLAEIRDLMTTAIGLHTMEEWEAFFSTEPEIIWERVRNHEEVRTDPQNIANDYVVDIDLPGSGKTSTVGTLMAFSDTPTKAPGPPPPLGEHTEEVMAALGFDAAEIKSVRDHSEAEKEAMLIALLGDN